MDTQETVMCPTCNVAMVNGVCPQCGMKAEDMHKADAETTMPEATEAPAMDAPAEEAAA